MIEEQEKEYDEDEAVAFIKQYISDKVTSVYDDDDILNVIDIVWDYYEEHDLLDVDDDESEVNLDSLNEYAKKVLKKDSASAISLQDLPTIIEGEIAYEKSIGLEA